MSCHFLRGKSILRPFFFGDKCRWRRPRYKRGVLFKRTPESHKIKWARSWHHSKQPPWHPRAGLPFIAAISRLSSEKTHQVAYSRRLLFVGSDLEFLDVSPISWMEAHHIDDAIIAVVGVSTRPRFTVFMMKLKVTWDIILITKEKRSTISSKKNARKRDLNECTLVACFVNMRWMKLMYILKEGNDWKGKDLCCEGGIGTGWILLRMCGHWMSARFLNTFVLNLT